MKTRWYYPWDQRDSHDNFVWEIPDDNTSMEDVLWSKDTLDNQPVKWWGYWDYDDLDNRVIDKTADILNNG